MDEQLPLMLRDRVMRRWFTVALANLCAAALIGCVLRAIYVVEIPFIRFKALLHAHSHVALLGWMFMAMTIFLLRDETAEGPSRLSRRLLWVAQLAVLGMLVAFPIEGYGPASITASSLHLLISYVLGWRIWKATAAWNAQGSRLLARMAIVFMTVSTIGVWAVPPITASGLFGTEIYYWSIQFFLHFQFNGWLWFGALALWSHWAETHGMHQSMDRFTIRLWVASVFLTFALAVAWSEHHPVVYAANSVGVLLQLWAGWRTARAIRASQQRLRSNAALWTWRCVTYALIGMGIKVAIQTAVAVPDVAHLAFTVRNYVIGFIHLNMLGAISLMLFAMALLEGWIVSTRRSARQGLTLFTSGVLLTEMLLFGQGTLWWLGQGTVPGYYVILLGVSLLIPAGALALLFHIVRSQRMRTSPNG